MSLLRIIILFILLSSLSGCGIGMLLFYRDAKSTSLYRSGNSKKNYLEVKATTLSHCGCTHLFVSNYENRKQSFNILYTPQTVIKTIYTEKDTIRLLAIESNSYTFPFDSTDKRIFYLLDSLIANAKMAYRPKVKAYKGYIVDPYTRH